MKITALTENISFSSEFGCEHGLSLFIETNSHKILFDMGQTDLFCKNAEKACVNLDEADIAVLSHGHYDHGGGLKRFLEINTRASVFVNKHAFEPHYNGTEKYIGLDSELRESGRIVFTGEEFRVCEGVSLFSCSERQRRFEIDTGGLNFVQNGRLVPEDFRHEQYLLIKENGKRVLFSGCSHKGILNIMEWFAPDFLIGGFHFMKRTCSESLKRDAKLLDRYKTVYYTCHCTGREQFEYMKPFVRELYYLSSGQTIVI